MSAFGPAFAAALNANPARYLYLFGRGPAPEATPDPAEDAPEAEAAQGAQPEPTDPAFWAPLDTDPAAPPAGGEGPAEAPEAEQGPSPCPGHPTADGGLAVPLVCAGRGHQDEPPVAETEDAQASAETAPEAEMLP